MFEIGQKIILCSGGDGSGQLKVTFCATVTRVWSKDEMQLVDLLDEFDDTYTYEYYIQRNELRVCQAELCEDGLWYYGRSYRVIFYR